MERMMMMMITWKQGNNRQKFKKLRRLVRNGLDVTFVKNVSRKSISDRKRVEMYPKC